MKAYKGFNEDMICRGYKFAEGQTYKHAGPVKLCESGFHACMDPLDCMRYYDPTQSVYHEVEADGVRDERKGDTKFVCKKLTIGARIGIKEMVKASIDFAFAACKGAKDCQAASGDWSCQAASGKWSKQAASGYGSSQAAGGNGSRQAASGYGSKQAASGDWSGQAASGNWSIQAASGDGSSQAAGGNGSKQAASGNGSSQAASGDGSKQAASGDGSRQAASGDWSRQQTTGQNCVMMSAGNGGRACGKKGSWIVLTEWVHGVPEVVDAKIDGETIKEDTWYTVKGGKLVAAEEIE